MSEVTLQVDKRQLSRAAKKRLNRRRWQRIRQALGAGGMWAMGFGAVAFISGLITYGAAVGFLPLSITSQTVSILLLVSLGFTIALAGMIALFVWRLWRQRRREEAGARLHIRVVVLFAIVAVVPSIMVAGFSAVTLNLGLQAWFSNRVGSVMEHSASVADAYLEEHRADIKGEAELMGTDLARALPLLDYNPKRFAEIAATQAFVRSLDEAVVFGLVGEIYGRGGRAPTKGAVQVPSQDILSALEPGKVRVVLDEDKARIMAVSRVGKGDHFLMLSRQVDPAVVQHAVRTRTAFEEYSRIDERRSTIQIGFAVFYIMVSLLVLLSAMWLGLWFAGRLVSPISDLIEGARRVRDGDFDARVEGRAADREIETLRRTFNTMASRLSQQTSELMQTNEVLDERRRFTEGVLAGVSAGVVGLDPYRRVTIINRSACSMLAQADEDLLDHYLEKAIPAFTPLIDEAFANPGKRVEGEVELTLQPTEPSDKAANNMMAAQSVRTVNVRAQVMLDGTGNIAGAIATFDDVTRLVSAQRMAAWGDVARRIAHEIKNPLTPIQLSAERLQRKYKKTIDDDKVFAQCTDTIIRHVGDIGRMVDEFSSFARMPQPVMRDEDVEDIAKQALFLHEVAHNHVTFSYDTEIQGPINLHCDRRLVAQATTNLLKNAIESIDGKREEGGFGPDETGHIAVSIVKQDGWIDLRVADNGKGLPEAERHKLTEPYVTTRSKGTGLGLAIVKKIMEDHRGEILLEDNFDPPAPGETAPRPNGAIVTLRFPSGVSSVVTHVNEGEGAVLKAV